MNSEKIAGLLGGIVAVIVLAAAFYYTAGTGTLTPKAPAAPAAVAPPATRGPVIREIPQ